MTFVWCYYLVDGSLYSFGHTAADCSPKRDTIDFKGDVKLRYGSAGMDGTDVHVGEVAEGVA